MFDLVRSIYIKSNVNLYKSHTKSGKNFENYTNC